MRAGLSSYTYTWAVGVPGHPPAAPLSVLGLLDRAEQLGVSVLQIADNLPLHSLSEHDLAVFAARAGSLGIDLEVGTRGIAPDHLSRYLQIASQLRSPILRVVIDTVDHHPSPAEATAILRSQRTLFEGAGITLAIENHDRFAVSVLADMVNDLGPSWVGICLDTVNSFGSLEGPQVVVDMLAPLAVNLHVKDFAVVRATHAMGFSIEGRPAGQGQLNVPWLLDCLRKSGRDPNAILELWTPLERSLEATIATERQWAAESISYLQHVLGQVAAPYVTSELP